MISKIEAHKLTEQYISQFEHAGGKVLVINDKYTQENDLGWVFFWTTKMQLDDPDNFSKRIAGNCPLLVLRGDGEIVLLPTAQTVEESLENYRNFGSAIALRNRDNGGQPPINPK